MNWTKKQPTEPGFYFYLQADGERICPYADGMTCLRATVVPASQAVREPYLRVHGYSVRCSVQHLEGQWLGPINPEMCGG